VSAGRTPVESESDSRSVPTYCAEGGRIARVGDCEPGSSNKGDEPGRREHVRMGRQPAFFIGGEKAPIPCRLGDADRG